MLIVGLNFSKSVYIYPIYFDAERTVSQGRRVPKTLAKSNPQAKDVLNAITKVLGLQAELESVSN